MAGHLAGRCLGPALVWYLLCVAARADDGQTTLDLRAFNDSNVTNGSGNGEIRADSGLILSASRGLLVDLDEVGLLELSGHARLTGYGRYSDLDELALGGEALLSRKLGLGLAAPSINAQISVDYLADDTSLRTGWLDTAMLGASWRVAPTVRISGGFGFEWRIQDQISGAIEGYPADVFTQFNHVAHLDLQLQLDDRLSVIAAIERRRGDAALSMPGALDAEYDDSLAVARDPVFGANWVTEKVEATSLIPRLGVSLACGRNASLGFSISRRFTREPGGDSYNATISDITYTAQF